MAIASGILAVTRLDTSSDPNQLITALVLAAIGVAITATLGPRQLDFLVLGAPITLVALLAAERWFDVNPATPEIALSATIAATLAASTALEAPRRQLPQTLCFGAATVTLLATSLSSDHTWLIASLLLAVSAIVLNATERNSNDPSTPSLALLESRMLIPASLALASGTAILAILWKERFPLSWPMAGATVTGLLGLAVLSANAYKSSTIQLERTSRESRIDALTGGSNRRAIDERLDEETARAIRYGHPLSILMIDLDDFKTINDRYGHAAGDEALRSTAVIIQESIRSIDIAGRFGGEEFLVILPETPIEGATIVAERIRSSMEHAAIVTASIGIAPLDPNDPASITASADQALYTAKRNGKNQVIVTSQESPKS